MPARKQTFTHAVAARRHAATHACTLLRVCMRRHGPGKGAVSCSSATLPAKRACESCPTFGRSVGAATVNACMAPEGCVEQAWVRGPSSADCLKAIRTETGCRGPHCRRARS